MYTKEQRMALIQTEIDKIYAMMERPNSRPLTNGEMKIKADFQRQGANTLRMLGIPTRPEFDQIDFTESLDNE